MPDADFEKDLFGGLGAYAEVTSGECPAWPCKQQAPGHGADP